MKDTEYKVNYNYVKNTTTIDILYKGACVFSLEFFGTLGEAAAKEYAIEAVEILIDKGVIK